MCWDEGEIYQLIECPACNNVLLREGYWHSELYADTGPNYELRYPQTKDSIVGLPENISKSYEAAIKVKNIDSNAFAVLLGRVLDLICIDKNAEGDSLFERLKDLATKNIMPEQLADMAHQLRQLRNIGAHANLGELTRSEIPILEALNRAILEYVYSAPTLIESVQEKIDALKTTTRP